MTKYLTISTILISTNFAGCATNELSSIIEGKSVESSDLRVSFKNYKYGTITKENNVLLCMHEENSEEFTEGQDYTVKFDVTNQLDGNNSIINKSHGQEWLRPIAIEINDSNINEGCHKLIEGKSIILFSGKRPFVYNQNTFRDKYKGISMFSSSYGAPSYKNNSVLYLYADNGFHQEIELIPKKTTEEVKCSICVIGLPFTFLFDVITSPIQLIYFLTHRGH